MRHIVGSYLHILRLLCDFAKRINHRKAPQSANINELQPRHTPAPVTNCLAVCTELCISQSSFLTRFDHSDGRLWHLCRHYSEIHSWNLDWNLELFSFFLLHSRVKQVHEIQALPFTQIVFERSHMFLHICALSLRAWLKCHNVVHLDSIKLQVFHLSGYKELLLDNPAKE